MSTAIVPLRDRVNSVRTLLEKSKSQMAMALPRHISADKMLRVVMTTIQRTPKLLECTQQSLLGAVMQASQLGLEPDGLLGSSYLVPYGNQCQLIIGYRGMLNLARNSGQISTIQAHEVCERDHFRFSYGLNPVLEHEPADVDDPGEIKAFYAVAKLKDGGTQFEVMWRRQVDAIRKRSRAAQSGPWVTDYAEMGKKTVLRRLCKMLPMSVELARAVAIDERAEAGLPQDLDTIELPEEAQVVETEKPVSKLDAVMADDRKARKAKTAQPTYAEGADPDPMFDRLPGEEG